MTLTEQDAKVFTDQICEALMREGDWIKRIGKRAIMEAILSGKAEMREISCKRCGGSGRVAPVVESSGGTFYRDERRCYIPEGCGGTGKVRKLYFKDGKR